MTSEIKQRIVYVLTRTNKADDDDTDVYVGSTSQPLNDRLCRHRYAATIVGNENNKLYKRMRTVGVQNWGILPLLSRTCNIKTIRELERKWCEILRADMNTALPILTPDERETYKADYYKSNKEAILKQHAKYYESNKEVILKRQTTYNESNKEAISKYQADYRKANKDAIKQMNANYYKLNIQSKRYYCNVCNVAFGCSGNLKTHFKTEKHKVKNFEQLIEGVHEMTKNGTFSQVLENLKETTL